MPRTYRPPCPSCRSYYNTYRLYVRAPHGKGYHPMGWHCKHCHHTWADDPEFMPESDDAARVALPA